MKVDLLFTWKELQDAELKGRVVVVIDVLRATSVMVTALANGARTIHPVEEVEEAIAFKARHPEVLLGGERGAEKIPGFDLSNSPLEYGKELVKDKELVLTTSNGTRAITGAKGADRVLLGCLLNATAVAEAAMASGKDLVLANAGTDGAFSMDDYLTAGAILERMLSCGPVTLSDAAQSALLLYWSGAVEDLLKDSLHYQRLQSLGLAKDLRYCLAEDMLDVVPEYRDGCIRAMGSASARSA